MAKQQSLEDRIAQAIGDPGSIVGFRDWNNDETVVRWGTRAVLAVLAERKIVDLPLPEPTKETPDE